jgi:hypothetical protein
MLRMHFELPLVHPSLFDSSIKSRGEKLPAAKCCRLLPVPAPFSLVFLAKLSVSLQTFFNDEGVGCVKTAVFDPPVTEYHAMRDKHHRLPLCRASQSSTSCLHFESHFSVGCQSGAFVGPKNAHTTMNRHLDTPNKKAHNTTSLRE